MASPREILEIAGREVTVTNPGKVYFPAIGLTKLDLVRFYLAVAGGALRGAGGRPMALKRYVNGIEGQAFYQKRAPDTRPEWISTVELKYPSGRSAHEIVLSDPAQLAWVVNLGCIDMHPHAVRAGDLEHPDELRIDLDPIPGVGWPQVREVALVVRDVLADFGLTGWPKTSGNRGMHIYCRVHPRWSFTEVRRAGLALAREVERRAPDLATSRWWKEERHGVFIDYNQNAKDRTTASAYSVRPTPDARVSTPLSWDEVPACDPADFTVATVLSRFAERGDPGDGIDESAADLVPLLDLAERQREEGMEDEPPPPPARGAATGGAEPPPESAGGAKSPTGRRRSTMPLVEVARAETNAEALAGLDRWKARHPDVVAHLEPADVLLDSMRGRSSTWARIRINLQHVPAALRPEQEPLEVDFDPWAGLNRDGTPAEPPPEAG
ncbi:MAG TPA: DNA polymerase domain-containing protein [Micromonosporaceae bacterium]|nr:DNA polymerase domain-containing protein [Micromonosporaceae bacterium]